MNRPNCFQCKHYFVTWDQRMPRGCKLFDIKSAHMPSIIVRDASGSECVDFQPKKSPPKEEEDPFDFNHPRFWGKK